MQQAADDAWIEAKPAILGDGFATEGKEKLAILVLLPGQSGIHEVEVPASLGMGILDGMPDDHGVGVKGGMALALGCGIP